MSDYRRLISYLYAYEEGVKGNNIGFAKLEARKENCRISVSVKKVYAGNNDIGVYLLGRDGEILIGKIFIRNGAGEFRTNINTDNIEDSGKTLDDCYGLTIHDMQDTLYTYTTIWDDILASNALTCKEEYEEDTLPENDTVTRSAIIDLADITSENIKQKEIQFKPQIKSKLQIKSEPEIIKPEAESEPEIKPEVKLEIKAETKPEVKLEIKAAEMPDIQLEKNTDDEPKYFSGPERPIGSWDYMEKNYAKLQAFECERQCEILALRPQDIGLLKRDIWAYGNNSFLLHGYYRYRHLILARLAADKGSTDFRYLLGVPGNYYSNEKYMASMFGFPNFILAKKQPSNDDRFGYWYTDIRLE